MRQADQQARYDVISKGKEIGTHRHHHCTKDRENLIHLAKGVLDSNNHDENCSANYISRTHGGYQNGHIKDSDSSCGVIETEIYRCHEKYPDQYISQYTYQCSHRRLRSMGIKKKSKTRNDDLQSNQLRSKSVSNPPGWDHFQLYSDEDISPKLENTGEDSDITKYLMAECISKKDKSKSRNEAAKKSLQNVHLVRKNQSTDNVSKENKKEIDKSVKIIRVKFPKFSYCSMEPNLRKLSEVEDLKYILNPQGDFKTGNKSNNRGSLEAVNKRHSTIIPPVVFNAYEKELSSETSKHLIKMNNNSNFSHPKMKPLDEKMFKKLFEDTSCSQIRRYSVNQKDNMDVQKKGPQYLGDWPEESESMSDLSESSQSREYRALEICSDSSDDVYSADTERESFEGERSARRRAYILAKIADYSKRVEEEAVSGDDGTCDFRRTTKTIKRVSFFDEDICNQDANNFLNENCEMQEYSILPVCCPESGEKNAKAISTEMTECETWITKKCFKNLTEENAQLSLTDDGNPNCQLEDLLGSKTRRKSLNEESIQERRDSNIRSQVLDCEESGQENDQIEDFTNNKNKRNSFEEKNQDQTNCRPKVSDCEEVEQPNDQIEECTNSKIRRNSSEAKKQSQRRESNCRPKVSDCEEIEQQNDAIEDYTSSKIRRNSSEGKNQNQRRENSLRPKVSDCEEIKQQNDAIGDYTSSKIRRNSSEGKNQNQRRDSNLRPKVSDCEEIKQQKDAIEDYTSSKIRRNSGEGKNQNQRRDSNLRPKVSDCEEIEQQNDAIEDYTSSKIRRNSSEGKNQSQRRESNLRPKVSDCEEIEQQNDAIEDYASSKIRRNSGEGKNQEQRRSTNYRAKSLDCEKYERGNDKIANSKSKRNSIEEKSQDYRQESKSRPKVSDSQKYEQEKYQSQDYSDSTNKRKTSQEPRRTSKTLGNKEFDRKSDQIEYADNISRRRSCIEKNQEQRQRTKSKSKDLDDDVFEQENDQIEDYTDNGRKRSLSRESYQEKRRSCKTKSKVLEQEELDQENDKVEYSEDGKSRRKSCLEKNQEQRRESKSRSKSEYDEEMYQETDEFSGNKNKRKCTSKESYQEQRRDSKSKPKVDSNEFRKGSNQIDLMTDSKVKRLSPCDQKYEDQCRELMSKAKVLNNEEYGRKSYQNETCTDNKSKRKSSRELNQERREPKSRSTILDNEEFEQENDQIEEFTDYKNKKKSCGEKNQDQRRDSKSRPKKSLNTEEYEISKSSDYARVQEQNSKTSSKLYGKDKKCKTGYDISCCKDKTSQVYKQSSKNKKSIDGMNSTEDSNLPCSKADSNSLTKRNRKSLTSASFNSDENVYYSDDDIIRTSTEYSKCASGSVKRKTVEKASQTDESYDINCDQQKDNKTVSTQVSKNSWSLIKSDTKSAEPQHKFSVEIGMAEKNVLVRLESSYCSSTEDLYNGSSSNCETNSHESVISNYLEDSQTFNEQPETEENIEESSRSSDPIPEETENGIISRDDEEDCYDSEEATSRTDSLCCECSEDSTPRKENIMTQGNGENYRYKNQNNKTKTKPCSDSMRVVTSFKNDCDNLKYDENLSDEQEPIDRANQRKCTAQKKNGDKSASPKSLNVCSERAYDYKEVDVQGKKEVQSRVMTMKENVTSVNLISSDGQTIEKKGQKTICVTEKRQARKSSELNGREEEQLLDDRLSKHTLLNITDVKNNSKNIITTSSTFVSNKGKPSLEQFKNNKCKQTEEVTDEQKSQTKVKKCCCCKKKFDVPPSEKDTFLYDKNSTMSESTECGNIGPPSAAAVPKCIEDEPWEMSVSRNYEEMSTPAKQPLQQICPLEEKQSVHSRSSTQSQSNGKDLKIIKVIVDESNCQAEDDGEWTLVYQKGGKAYKQEGDWNCTSQTIKAISEEPITKCCSRTAAAINDSNVNEKCPQQINETVKVEVQNYFAAIHPIGFEDLRLEALNGKLLDGMGRPVQLAGMMKEGAWRAGCRVKSVRENLAWTNPLLHQTQCLSKCTQQPESPEICASSSLSSDEYRPLSECSLFKKPRNRKQKFLGFISGIFQ